METALRCVAGAGSVGASADRTGRVYRRYLKLEAGHAEEFVEFLKTRGLWNEAALRLAAVVNDDLFVVRALPAALIHRRLTWRRSRWLARASTSCG